MEKRLPGALVVKLLTRPNLIKSHNWLCKSLKELASGVARGTLATCFVIRHGVFSMLGSE